MEEMIRQSGSVDFLSPSLSLTHQFEKGIYTGAINPPMLHEFDKDVRRQRLRLTGLLVSRQQILFY